jgi:PhzF family phenazine biosynthesis protein
MTTMTTSTAPGASGRLGTSLASARRRFQQVTVFSAEPMLGNPLAVVHGAEGLDDAAMAALARWTNLSETTFLLPPTDPAADYRVRIWTPFGELPFAGHPTLGSCWAWLSAGGQARQADHVVQECGVGLVTVRRDGTRPASSPDSRLSFSAPPLRRDGPVDEATLQLAAAGLGLARDEIVGHQWVDNGPGWFALMLGSAERLLALQPDWSVLGSMKFGVVAPQLPGRETQFEVRGLFNGLEDPVTGSLNAGLGQWLIGAGLAPEHYVAAQGHALGRAGRVHVQRENGTVWVGGDVTPVIEGMIAL